MRRAIYVLVWRVVKRLGAKGREKISDMIATWMDFLGMRVPGAHIVLVVTHVDTLLHSEVHEQVNWAAQVVRMKLLEISREHPDQSVLPFEVWNEGQSLWMNGRDGTGGSDVAT